MISHFFFFFILTACRKENVLHRLGKISKRVSPISFALFNVDARHFEITVQITVDSRWKVPLWSIPLKAMSSLPRYHSG